MSTKTTLRIAEPCHENWDKMTSTEKGRFCQSCCKQVVDFSLLNDRQILEYFSKQKEDTCGRFREDQLDRSLDNQRAKNKISLWKWFVTMALGVWVSNKALSQSLVKKADHEPKMQTGDTTYETITFGMVAQKINAHGDKKPVKHLNITGKIVNDKNEPVSGASISLNGEGYASSASDGTFHINGEFATVKDRIELSFSSVGYETKNVKVLLANKKDILIEMKPKATELKEVVVTGYGTMKGKVCITGAVTRVSTSSLTQVVDSIKRFTDNTLNKTSFNVYPNPVQKGSSVNITVKEDGAYSMQLISNASQLISSQKITAVKGQIFQLQISSSLASGIYYIRMVNEETGKLYTDKVVVL
jgi:hypothetical protein